MEVFFRKKHHHWTEGQLLEYQTNEVQPFVSTKWAHLPVGLGPRPQAEPRVEPPAKPQDGDPAGHLTLPKFGKVVGGPTAPFDTHRGPALFHGSGDARASRAPLPGFRVPLIDAPAGSPGDDDDPDDDDDWGGGRGGGNGGRGGGRGGRNGNHSDRPNRRDDDQRNQSRCLVDLSKIYRDDDRYKGIDDSFELKISIFGEHCRRVCVPSEMTMIAFPIMLSGAARDYYQANLSNLPDSFDGLCEMMVKNFEGPEHQRNMLLKWNNVTFKAYIEKSPTVDPQEVFNTMIADLRFLQHTIPMNMRDSQSYYIKILSACDGVPECHSAICNPRTTVSELVNQIKQTIDSYLKRHFQNKTHLLRHSLRIDVSTIVHLRTPLSENPIIKDDQEDDSDDDDHLIDQYFTDTGSSEEVSRTFFASMGACDGSSILKHYTASNERYNDDKFFGIMIDTGAAQRSTVGYNQYLAWKKIEDVEYDKTTAGQVTVQFGIGATTSIGSFYIKLPFGDVEWNVMEADVPFLLCLADMDRLKFKYDNLDDVAITPKGVYPVYRRFGHAFLLWNVNVQDLINHSINSKECYLTEVELQRIHRRFGHPSARKFHKVLKRSGHDEDFEAIKQLTKFCHHCQVHGKSPGRFKFSLPDKNFEFNHTILVDVLYINNDPILHIVDEATRFQAARWLSNVSAKHTWDKLRECWIDTYIGPPEYITHDAGIVERFHAPLRRSYGIIYDEVHKLGISRAAILQMAVKAINDTAGPDGLVPTLLVFGTFPRIVENSPPTPTIQQRAAAISKAMIEIRKLHSSMQVREALNTRNGPSTTALHDLLPNSTVLVWREGNGTASGEWKGPFPLLGMDGETCTLDLPHGPTRFRSTSVKTYYQIDQIDHIPGHPDGHEITLPKSGKVRSPVFDTPVTRATNPEEPPLGFIQERPDTYTNIFPTSSHTSDSSSYTRSIPRLLCYQSQGSNHVVPLSDVPSGTRIFKSRFVDEIKNEGMDTEFRKSRLVIQAYNDIDKTTVLTQSPTIQRSCQRILVSLAASTRKNGTGVYIRDITQAYTQSTSNLHRTFYAHAPEEMNLPANMVLLVVKPLYGVPEAGNHWFKTYHTHHCEKLRMQQSTYDPCLLHTKNEGTGLGIVGLQTDDTLIIGDSAFIQAEDEQLKQAGFMAKDREELTPDHPLKFNGVTLTLKGDDIYLDQQKQCNNLQLVSIGSMDMHGTRGKVRKHASTHEQYVAQRARGAYVATMCQPEASFDLSMAAQTTQPDKDDIAMLNKRIKWQKENSARGLNYIPLDLDSLKIVVFADASFANNKDYSSQIGYVIIMMDKHNNANIIHWSSIKCKRVTRSVLASELYGLVQGFDIGAAITSTVSAILGKEVPLIFVH
ncbi:hypothetical protein DID88_002402 [Monilinia fructigena]|uniref:Reverse transcriptase Ty1/copia-type domain-containing protein n=1 Tax=Monilinia fructigena TaxID=38457 RepID=A0A395IR90_9HELO|nr:hypothetical protein DID88_002402 [Monilinia fructigena]